MCMTSDPPHSHPAEPTSQRSLQQNACPQRHLAVPPDPGASHKASNDRLHADGVVVVDIAVVLGRGTHSAALSLCQQAPLPLNIAGSLSVDRFLLQILQLRNFLLITHVVVPLLVDLNNLVVKSLQILVQLLCGLIRFGNDVFVQIRVAPTQRYPTKADLFGDLLNR